MDSEKQPASHPSAPLSFKKVSSVPSSSSVPTQTKPLNYSPAASPEGSIPLTIHDLWRPTATDNSRAATLLNPFLGFHPTFVPAYKTFNPDDSQLCTSGVNGWYNFSPSKSSNICPPPAKKKEKTQTNLSWSQKSLCEPENVLTAKQKDLMKKQLQTPRFNGCLSGPLSKSSSEETSSDPDNMEKEDEDLSTCNDDSKPGKEILVEKKHLTHNTSESKEKGPFAVERNTSQESVPVISSNQLHSHSVPVGLPSWTAVLFHSAQTTEENQQQTGVLHPTGLAIHNISLAPPHREAYTSPSYAVANPIFIKSKSVTKSQKRQISSSPQHGSTSKHLCAGLLKPIKTKPPTRLASKQSSHKCKLLIPLSKIEHPADRMVETEKNAPNDSLLYRKKIAMKKAVQLDSVMKASSVQTKNQNCHPKQFLNPQPNKMISTQAHVPLALLAKPCNQTNSANSSSLLVGTNSPCLTPINLSSGLNEASETSAVAPKSYAPALCEGWRLAKNSLWQKPTDLTRSSGSDFNISKAPEDSSKQEEEENSVHQDSGSNLADSESIPKSDVSEDHSKECVITEVQTAANRNPLNAASLPSLNFASNCFLPKLQDAKLSGQPITHLLNQHDNQPPSLPKPGVKKRRRVIDERVLQLPLEFGWQRETRVRNVAGRLQAEVSYFAPCGKKLRHYSDVVKYLVRHGIADISQENFSFSTKIKVGSFYEGREGPKGLEWSLLAEEDIDPCILAMDGRCSWQTKSKNQPTTIGTEANSHPVNYGEHNAQDVADPKLICKLKAQEMAQQAVQIKLMRKIEKQAMVKATKEAKKQQVIMAAEERRKKREAMKTLKQQEKIKRIQHIRMEKEVRAQQILEEKRRKKEAAANLKLLEAEKRNKEREIRKLQSALQKHQERERRRQHMILMKALEARKKAEEKERLKKEKKEEKQLNKKKKLELRRLEQKKAKELMTPKEDMCLTDHKPLPELPHIPGLILPEKTVSDCLMVLEFVHNFGTVLKLGSISNQLTIGTLQDGLLNIGNGLQKVQELLVGMLSAAVCDPGVPAGHKCKTMLGDHLTSVEINKDNVSEILQIYMEAHSDQMDVAALAHSLQTKAFQAHSPSEKATMLAFLVNKLCCCKAVISEIDRNIDYMSKLRKEKWVLERKLRKLRNIHANTTEKRYNNVEEEKRYKFSSLTVQSKHERKNGDSDEEEEHDGYSEEMREKERKKAEICEVEKAATQSGDIKTLETKIQEKSKLQSAISQKLFEASHLLRSMMVGEDRYRRRYWLLPQCGGVFIEGLENGCVEVEKKEQVEMSEQRGENAKTTTCDLEAANVDQESNIIATKTHHNEVSNAQPYYSYCSPKADKNVISFMLSAAQLSSNSMTCSSQSTLPPNQASQIFTEKSREWFSLLPRSPCDGSSNRSQPAFYSPSQLVRNRPSLFLVSKTPKPAAGITSLQPAVTQGAEDNRDEDLCLADCNSVNRNKTTEPLSNNPTAQEVAETPDCVCPQPVPEEMLRGWWNISNVENLHSLVKALHSRGVRERLLQKQIQKNMKHMSQIFANRTNELDAKDQEVQKEIREILEGWCVEQRAMEADTSLLLQVEALEKKVISANLHEQGWMTCDPQSDSKDLLYSVPLESKLQREAQQEKVPGFLIRRSNNPLDIAVSRLAELGRNIECSSEEKVDAGMRQWHKALGQVRSSAQLSLCIQHLQKTIVWKRVVMKVLCQLCQKGDNEELLLLCDGCDKGFHTYCHDPKIATVPVGSWFCSFCESGQTAGGKQKSREVKFNSKPSGMGELISEEVDSSNEGPKRGFKEFQKRKREDNSVSLAKKAKTSKESDDKLAVCRALLAELESHQDAWPFLSPVRHKTVPGYRKVIKKPMDFHTIKEKLTNNLYVNPETFTNDVNLVFENCQKFNKDNSEIGRAGHRMRRFFNKRWTELLHHNKSSGGTQ